MGVSDCVIEHTLRVLVQDKVEALLARAQFMPCRLTDAALEVRKVHQLHVREV